MFPNDVRKSPDARKQRRADNFDVNQLPFFGTPCGSNPRWRIYRKVFIAEIRTSGPFYTIHRYLYADPKIAIWIRNGQLKKSAFNVFHHNGMKLVPFQRGNTMKMLLFFCSTWECSLVYALSNIYQSTTAKNMVRWKPQPVILVTLFTSAIDDCWPQNGMVFCLPKIQRIVGVTPVQIMFFRSTTVLAGTNLLLLRRFYLLSFWNT